MTNSSSGTTDWFLSNADIILEAFDRLRIRPQAVTREMMVSARRSLNLELTSTYSNNTVNLWKVDQQTVPLQQGVATYAVPSDTVTTLDVYLRTFQLSNTFDVAVNFTTTFSTPAVTVVVANHGLQIGTWLSFVTPVTIGGIVLSGFYQAASVIDTNTFTVTAASNATSSVSNLGALRNYATVNGSTTVTCTFANHDLIAGEQFNIGALTTVGGIQLFGSYTVLAVTNANVFTFAASTDASQTTSGYENTNLLDMTTQSSADPIDRILLPVGRSDYVAYPDKIGQAAVTTYWFDRTLSPTITLWPNVDGNGPYELLYYRMVRVQDANATMGETPDIPFRFLEALCAGMAYRLATKYMDPALLPVLGQELKEQYKIAMAAALTEDRERAPLQILPNFSVYQIT